MNLPIGEFFIAFELLLLPMIQGLFLHKSRSTGIIECGRSLNHNHTFYVIMQSVHKTHSIIEWVWGGLVGGQLIYKL
jgi:hypothetical protein